VFENIAFGLTIRRLSRRVIRERVERVLETMDLSGCEDRSPGQLSGGQQQRVALARAIVIEPDLLLLDEPLSNLDAKLRIEMRAELRSLQKSLKITMLYVTHDQAEALSLSDRIVVMNQGHIEQMGSPEEIYYRPKTAFVARFMGFDNHFDARVTSVEGKTAVVRAGEFTLRVTLTEPDAAREDDEVQVLFRPSDAHLRLDDGPNHIPGELDFGIFQGDVTQYSLITPLGRFSVSETEDAPQTFSRKPYIAVAPEKLIVPSRGD
jgi:ABC-type Fe3+/spermidine/putrescine transport system ATPase subunit